MTREVITDLVVRGEGSTVEFKRSLSRELDRELCAFANAGGGTILIGVSDAGEVVGVADHNRLKSRVHSIARSADPAIVVEVESVDEVLRVAVPSQSRKPYSFGGRFFMCEGASTQQMSNAEVEDLFYAVGRLHFDRIPCEEFSLESELDAYIWMRFSRRARIPEAMDRVIALRNLGLLDGRDRMTHAGAWLLARDVRRFTTSAHVSCALFMGTKKVRTLDRRDFYSRSAISNALGHRSVSVRLKRAVHSPMADGMIEYIIPEKPNSRLQEYRLTERCRSRLEHPHPDPSGPG